MDSVRNNIERPSIAFILKQAGIALVMALIFLTVGCSKDEKTYTRDDTIPENESWDINTVLDLNTLVPQGGSDPYIEPQIAVTQDQGRVHIAYFRHNADRATATAHPYCLMYRSFAIDDMFYLNDSNTIDETVVLLEDDGRNIADISIAIAGGKPVVAYSVYKRSVIVPDADLNNQGDVMVAVRDGANSWRVEIGAYGYVERNPVFVDGLAQSGFCIKGDGSGHVLLTFQFYYEGVDSYNFIYPDLRYISQPVNAFVNGTIADMETREETVQGNVYQNNGSGQQSNSGGNNDLILDQDDNPVVFYYHDNSENGPALDRGLRVGRRVTDNQGATSWQSEYIESGIDVVAIKGAVTSDGRLVVAYTVKDLPDFIDTDVELPYVIKYAEQVNVVTGVDEEGEDIVVRRWHTEFVNYNTICGRFCSLTLDSNDQPVVAYFDEMNFTLNRFFSRVKVSRREVGGAWTVDLIVPEDVGLSNNTSPLDVEPGLHDIYYIGKYNHLWIDVTDRVYLVSYSTENRKLYLFAAR
ncbi:MAG: hypothetical protein WC799_11080 [Desulfobacteraceae bacterium]|jgi:hypothetical protein